MYTVWAHIINRDIEYLNADNMADGTGVGSGAMISQICGENIRVRKDGLEAEWHHDYSGGCLFSATPIDRNQQYRIRLSDGSSHIDVGFTQKDPFTCQNLRIAYSQHHFRTVGKIRLHRTELEVTVSCSQDKFSCKTNDTIPCPIDPGPVWIYVNIKFGKANVRLEATNSRKISFHDIYGENIVMEDNKCKAKLSNEHPSAVCILEKPLLVGDKIKFELKPNTSGSRSDPPHYYHVTFGVSSLSPQALRVTAPEIFSVSNNVTSMKSQESRSHLGRIDHYRKSGRSEDGCDGSLTVTRSSESIIHYKHSRQSESDKERSINTPVYLFFELFRASVLITEDNSSGGYAVMSPGDDVEVDSKPKVNNRKEPREDSWHSCSGEESSRTGN
ncbi:uncharacterized protein [Argopecten irradians]|uniref:uncharacterized protein isoform X3 n=1 Tax=Argopecten irradians TaxID=31199 RepID=UPI0037225CA1